MADSVRAAAAARVSSYQPPGVERGVTGKEREFQQNRQFGPGPIKPYNEPEPRATQSGDGVYRGGAKTRPIPSGGRGGPPRLKGAPRGANRAGEQAV